jgi:hypothetical protein
LVCVPTIGYCTSYNHDGSCFTCDGSH